MHRTSLTSLRLQASGIGLVFALALGPRAALADDIRQEDLNSSLIHAAGQGDATSFNLALGLGANINAVDRLGNNAVLLATQGQQRAMLRTLLDRGVNPDARGGSGFTPLTYAAMRGLDTEARWLLKASARPDLRNALGDTPLHLAARFGHTAIVDQLLDAGARVDEISAAGETALIVAIRAGQRKVFDTLLARRAQADAHDKTGRTALFWAILENQEAMAVALIEHDARIESLSDGYTPLAMARIMGHDGVIAAITRRDTSR